jgi:hypothetical protein
MPDLITRSTYLEISSTPLATPAWRILDLSRLYGMSKRGADLVMHGAEGVRPYERIVTIRSVALPLIVEGRQNREGTTYGNIYEGLDDNIDALMTAVVVPPGTTEGTRAAVWHRATGNLTADLHVEGLEPERWGKGWIRFSLELSNPAGRWATPP